MDTLEYHHRQESSYLHPEDAVFSPPRQRQNSPLGRSDTVPTATIGALDARKRREKRRGRSSSRRRKVTWQKLLWVKQKFPDNYTDEETFLDHLQRNPRLRPYEFWPLVADSTIIVEHVCSVVIFVCCFTGIFQERVSPQTVVGWATIGTVAGWVLRDYWRSWEEIEQATRRASQLESSAPLADNEVLNDAPSIAPLSGTTSSQSEFGMPFKEQRTPLYRNTSSGPHTRHHSGSSLTNLDSTPVSSSGAATPSTPLPPYNVSPRSSALSPRMQERFMTAKSAILIYCSLLGLSPILKSLTISTSSDSIWALSFWLMILNVFTFDYGAGPEAKFPASLSTNAALMASTVLASRLPTTTHVFSLTLFSIEVFGLFPVFRRHLRHHSWSGHLCLTTALVIMAAGGLSMTISGGGWAMGAVGIVLGGIVVCLSLGLTSWWLIGLQRYKNEIHGPWDPARPVIRRGWD
nr:phosphatidylinositol n-acetylglucosaminyltransferase gpi2 subunit [Quercus suber]